MQLYFNFFCHNPNHTTPHAPCTGGATIFHEIIFGEVMEIFVNFLLRFFLTDQGTNVDMENPVMLTL